MARTNKVHIVGAGLSGMVAAINLAREGYQVTVLEAARKIGVHPIHPSNHSTPFNLKLIKDYVGIDITPALVPCNIDYIYAYSRKYRITSWDGYSLERGPRKTSMDSFLYNEALKLGVTFEFNRKVTDPFDLPDPTIIATGIFGKEMYKAFHRPAVRLHGFLGTRPLTDPDRQGDIRTWFGPYTNTYAYGPIINGLDNVTLFSDRDDLDQSGLQLFEEELERSDGAKFDHWKYFEVFVPTGRPDAPRLFVGSKILAGTLSGMMEPGAYFGIHGALVSGKVAARAVSDPEGAVQDFKNFTKGFKQCWYMNRHFNNPHRQYLYRLLLRFPNKLAPLLKFADTGIPGIEHYYDGMIPEYFGRY